MQIRGKAHTLLVLCLLGAFVTSGSMFDVLVHCVSTSSSHSAIEFAHAVAPCGDDTDASERVVASATRDCEDMPLGLSIVAVSHSQRGVDIIPPLQPVALVAYPSFAGVLADWRPAPPPSEIAADAVAPLLRGVILLV